MAEDLTTLLASARGLQEAMGAWSPPSQQAKSRQEELQQSLGSLITLLSAPDQNPADQDLKGWSAWLQVLQTEFQELLMPRQAVMKAVRSMSAVTGLIALAAVAIHALLLYYQEMGTGVSISPMERTAIYIGMVVVAGLWGAIGSSVATLIDIGQRYMNGSLSYPVLVDHYTKPLRGAFVGAVIFLLVQAGLLNVQDNDTALGEQRSLVIFAMAALSGFYEDGFMAKTRALLEALLGTQPNKGQAG